MATHTWPVSIDGAEHAVELKGSRTVLVDGVAHSLGGLIHQGPRFTTFELAGHTASVTYRWLSPTLDVRLGRALNLGRFGWKMPFKLIATAFGGAGAAAATVGPPMLWEVWELTIDGDSRGCWVWRSWPEPGFWRFVEPGQPLPDPDWPDWPFAKPGDGIRDAPASAPSPRPARRRASGRKPRQ